jgi:lipopolysaccharide export system permease protein
MSTLDRYIFWEQAKVFFISLIVLLCVLLLEKVNFLSGLLLTKDASFKSIGLILLYLSPSFLVLAAPLATLMSALLTFSRLAADNEITAMKTGGLSTIRIIAPTIALSTLALLATVHLSVNVAHEWNLNFQEAVADIIKSNLSAGIKERRFNESFKNLLIHVNGNNDGALTGIFISDQRDLERPRIIEARKGTLRTSDNGQTVTMELEKGVVHTMAAEGSYRTMGYDSYTLKVSAGEEYTRPVNKEIPQLSLPELSARIAALTNEGIPASAEKVAFHKAFSAPVGCLVLGILGATLGLLTHKRGSAGGFGLGVLMIVINYLLWMIGQGLGSEGKLPPVLAIWAPDIIMGAVGLYLIYMVSVDAEPPKALRMAWSKIVGWKAWKR